MARLLLICCFLFTLVNASTIFAAQSTADVSASFELKDSMLKEVLGERVTNLQRDSEYVIGHGDILTVSIFEEGDMAATAAPNIGRGEQSMDAPRTANSGTRVMMDGRISLRDIGDVEVVGLTLTELADYLKKLYAVIYSDPIVTTTLAQSNSLRYTVMGEVAQPGIFFLDYPMNLVQVIARSKGFTEWANKELTVVRQKLRDRDKKLFKGNTLEFDYDDFVSGKKLETNIYIQSGDIVIVH